jgi:hypothetical protein
MPTKEKKKKIGYIPSPRHEIRRKQGENEEREGERERERERKGGQT